MGTPHYMSPEQVRGAKADARSDIFSLGCVFYELLTGHKPFDAESMHGVLFKIMQEEPVPLREAAPGTPEALAHVVEKALAKNPDERFAERGRHAGGVASGPQRGGWRDVARSGPRSRARRRPAARPAPRRAGARAEHGSASRTSGPRSRRAAPAGAPDRPGRGRPRDRRRGLGAAELRPRPAGPAARAERRGRSLARRAIDSQVEVARRRLDAGSFPDAAREAERALKLDPQNAGARRVLDEAGAALEGDRRRRRRGPVGPAADDRERLAGAAFDLMTLDPGHPEAERAATAAGRAFRPRAEGARRLEQEARRAAEEAGAERTAAFAEGADLEQKGDQALRPARRSPPPAGSSRPGSASSGRDGPDPRRPPSPIADPRSLAWYDPSTDFR